jgi:D-glycero-D-manno-heptose 1,7-bisphosphate phosphatase
MRSIPTASTGPILRGIPLGFPGPLRRAVLLDRDGTLVEEAPHLHDPAEVALLPGVAGALAALTAAGYARACRCRKRHRACCRRPPGGLAWTSEPRT